MTNQIPQQAALFAKLKPTLRIADSGTAWELSGVCPQCDHHIAKLIPKKGHFGLTVRKRPPETVVATAAILTCNCQQHPEGGLENGGCGFSARVPLKL